MYAHHIDLHNEYRSSRLRPMMKPMIIARSVFQRQEEKELPHASETFSLRLILINQCISEEQGIGYCLYSEDKSRGGMETEREQELRDKQCSSTA